MSVKSASSVGEASGPVVRAGYLKKLKTSKKRYFVLRAETCESSARLEYYENEKKFNSGHAPKRSIPLKTCFNINKRHDTKHKHVIALYTKDDCFCVVFESEEELDAWLKALLSQQQGEEVADGATPRPTFEHVWQVKLLERGLGASSILSGNVRTSDSYIYRLCLTDKALSLIRGGNDMPQVELSLSSIRSCGCLKNYFFLEAGRSSGIGAGELFMEAEDATIAANIHQTVFHKMTSNSSSSREELRNRSGSATEASKPNNGRRQTMTGTAKPIPCFPSDQITVDISAPCTSNNNNTTSGNVAWPGTVNHQRTRSLPLAHPAPITTDNPIHPPRAAKRSANQSSKCFTDGRTRSDSMPSRPRTTSEGNHPLPGWNLAYLPPHRPVSIHRDISHSPPSGSPVSPPSATCSTDSAGSSQSIDESEGWYDVDVSRTTRCTTSITPDEAIVEENCDDCTDSPCIIHSSPIPSSYVPMAPISSDDGYVDMSPRGQHLTMSPAASMSSVTSGTPSTDMRFAEYPLEKVTSYFPPSEEEETSSTERPRTYSMGSKPYKIRIEQARDRAWSVGSKSKKGYNRVLPPHGSHSHSSAKSSSAPMLSNTRLHSSHSSIDPMDDLMEMDFSKKSNSGYMEMKPAPKVPFGYVRMGPGPVEKDTTPYVDMRPGSSPVKPSYMQNDYMEMDRKSANKIIPATSPENLSVSSYNSLASRSPTMDYNDVIFKNNLDNYMASPVRSTLSGFSHGSPSSIDYIDMDYATPRSEPDGYVEMSLGKASVPQQHQSLSDYTNMSLGNKKRNNKPKIDAPRSQPITIQNPPPQKTNASPLYSPLTTRTPPKMYLPLQNSPYSSLPRQRSRKNSRRDSKDSSSSSVTTPSSSSTIFPFSLNSPSSPSQIQEAAKVTTTLKIPQAVLNAKYTASFKKDDYTTMDFSHRPIHDYVNYKPTPTSTATTTPIVVNNSTKEKDDEECTKQISSLDLGDYSSMCFTPIDESKTENNNNSRPSSTSRPSSESSEVSSSTIVAISSRPPSVNSAGNASTELLHYASLDLAQTEDEANKSPRNSKEQEGFTYAEIDFNRSEGLKNNLTKIKQ